jgi:hypothetical protein
LEVYDSSLVEIVELTLVPVRLCIAEVICFLFSVLAAVNHWDIILKIF